MSSPTEPLLVEKPELRPRIYAYAIHDDAHEGLLKVGQTSQPVKVRVAQQLKTAAITNYTIVLDEPAERDDGSIITDHEVRARLKSKHHENPMLEWMRCTVEDVMAAIIELRTGKESSGTAHATYAMRAEQRAEGARLGCHGDVGHGPMLPRGVA